MKFAHILARVTGTPWSATEETLTAVTTLLQSRINGESLPAAAAPAEPAPPPVVQAGGISLVSLRGIIGKRLSAMETMCGGCDLDEFSGALSAALADPASDTVVILFDSPGGTVTGTPEMFTRLLEMKGRGTKRIYAYSDTKVCSAAYYLAAACDGIFLAPTARAGSIGVVAMVRDVSAKMEKEGIKLHVFTNGKDKALGADGTVPAALAEQLQAEADFLGEMFRGDVMKARPQIAPEAAQGRAYYGDEAVRLGLADAVFTTLEDCLAALAARAR